MIGSMNGQVLWAGAAGHKMSGALPLEVNFCHVVGISQPGRRQVQEAPMKTLVSLGLACGISLALAACGGSGSDTIKFGIGGPITGSNAAFGSQLKQGAEQAIADLNAGSGILGKKVSATVGDDAADPKQGVSVANNFTSAGVRYVIGHFNSGVTNPTSQIYQENNIL